MLLEYLKSFGLTGYEAQVYITLVQKGVQTGYELAHASGLPRASVYSALSSLRDKGGALKVGAEPSRYVAVKPSEFTSNRMRFFCQAAEAVVNGLKFQDPEPDTIAILDGEEAIVNQTINLLSTAGHTVYISAASDDLARFAAILAETVTRGVKVVVLSSGSFKATGMILYASDSSTTWLSGQGRPISLIVDSSLILTGELGRGETSKGVYSRNASLVMMSKRSFVQEIILFEARSRFDAEFTAAFGADFAMIRQKITDYNPPGKEDR